MNPSEEHVPHTAGVAVGGVDNVISADDPRVETPPHLTAWGSPSDPKENSLSAA